MMQGVDKVYEKSASAAKSFHYKFITEKLLLVDDRWVRRFYELVLWLSL